MGNYTIVIREHLDAALRYFMAREEKIMYQRDMNKISIVVRQTPPLFRVSGTGIRHGDSSHEY